MSVRLQAAVSFFVFALVATGVGIWFVLQPRPAYAQGSHHYYIVMTDFHFSPSHMVWHAGEHVWITLVNESQAKPGRIHEFHIGRDPVLMKTPFQRPTVGGWFNQDFFKGVVVRVSHGRGVNAFNHPWDPLVGPDAHKPYVSVAGYSLQTHTANPNDQEIDLNPGGTITIDFTVPNKPGTWGYACFRQTGQHFLNGMHGTVTVLR